MLMVKPFAAALCLATFALTTATSVAEAQGRRNWELTVSNAKLGRIAVPSPLGEKTSYWFFAFTIENKSGAERPLGIFVRGADDEDKAFHEGFWPDAEKLAEERLGGERLTMSERPKTIADGAKVECLAILGPVNKEADVVAVDISGLAETVLREKGKEFHLPRVKRFSFRRAGDEFYTSFDLVEAGSSEWVELSDRRQLPNAARPKRD